MTRKAWKLAALGGAQTFGAQAAALMLQKHPEFTEIVYYPTADAALAAVLAGEAGAMCGPEQMMNTGFHAGMHARMAAPDSRLHVIAQTTHAYHCALLGKPGAGLAQIRKVLGHTGSVTQSRPWLEANLPQAAIEIVGTNSLGAARSVLEGDGSIASVGTAELARECGLAELARDIDGGSVGSYWAISREARFSDAPTRVVLAGRFGGGGELSALIAALAGAGYALQGVSSKASGKALYEYDYLLRFKGTGRLDAIRAALAPFDSARLAGAFVGGE